MSDEFQVQPQQTTTEQVPPQYTPPQYTQPVQYTQPQYTPPQQEVPPQYTPPQQEQHYTHIQSQPPILVKLGRGKGWIGYLRVLLWILFGIICLGGLFISGQLMRFDAGMGFMVLLAAVAIAFTTVAWGMATLDCFQNTQQIATNTALMLDELKRMSK